MGHWVRLHFVVRVPAVLRWLGNVDEKGGSRQYTFLTPWWDEILPLAKNCVSGYLTVD